MILKVANLVDISSTYNRIWWASPTQYRAKWMCQFERKN